MKRDNLKYVYLTLSIVILAYIIICQFFVSFSISVTLYFVAAAVILFALYYLELNPINKEEDEPNPIYIFIRVAAIVFFAMTFLLLFFNILYPKKKPINDYDYIIVFGAGINGKNEIINSRLDNAILYADRYKKCKFVLTGAKGQDEPIEEAFYMKDYMVKRGVEEYRIIAEPFSINTYENITNSLELIKIDVKKRNARDRIITRPFYNKKGVYDLDFINIGFMSSDFHMTRIIMMAKKEGIYNPYVVICKTNPMYVPYMYIRENLSLFKAIILNQLKL